MRFGSEYRFYCSELGRSISPRTWDRIILDLSLSDCSIFERHRRLRTLAKIRKGNPRLHVSVETIERYQAIEKIATLPDGTKGSDLYRAVLDVRSISEVQFRRWVAPSGVNFGRNSEYSGIELKSIVQQLIIRLVSKPELVCFRRKVSGNKGELFLWTS